MAEQESNLDTAYQAGSPNPDLKSLDWLVGTWQLTGDTDGTNRFEWMEGGFFLLQHFDFEYGGHTVKGMEIIGHLQPFGAEPSADIKSRVYDTRGNTLDYVYEVEGETLIIWAGEKGSPAYYRGTISGDRNRCSGTWVFPGGGGYSSTMTRVAQ